MAGSGGVGYQNLGGAMNPNLPGFNPENLPPGYEFDPLNRTVQRTPTSVGQRLGQAQTGAYQAGPLSGLLAAGGIGGAGGAGGSGTGTGTPARIGWPGAPMGMITSGGPNTPTGSTGSGGPPSGGGTSSGTAVQDAAFGRAKDQVGQQSRGAVSSLNDELASQGLGGSGAQVQGTKDVIQSGAENLANVSSGLATKASENAIVTRGQDIGQQEAQFAGGIQQRGQDIQAQQAAADNALRRQLASMGLLQQAMAGLSGAGAAFQY